MENLIPFIDEPKSYTVEEIKRINESLSNMAFMSASSFDSIRMAFRQLTKESIEFSNGRLIMVSSQNKEKVNV